MFLKPTQNNFLTRNFNDIDTNFVRMFVYCKAENVLLNQDKVCKFEMMRLCLSILSSFIICYLKFRPEPKCIAKNGYRIYYT